MEQNSEKFVRELDSFEEFFWQLEQLAPVGNIAGAEVLGHAELASWENAWAELHRLHPALSFSVRKEAGERPHFVHTQTSSPLAQASNSTDRTLTAHMEDALKDGFGLGNGSLARLSIGKHGSSTFLILIVHHALMDGSSILALLQELLALVNGEQVQPSLPGWPSLRTVVGSPERAGYRSSQAAGKGIEVSDSVEKPPAPALQVAHLSLSEEETSALLQAAHAHQTSVHGALLAAVALAEAAAGRAAVSSNTAHNARPKDARESLGMTTTAIVTKIDTASRRDFWKIAAQARADTLPWQTEEGHRRFIAIMDELTAEERSPIAFAMTLPQSPVSYEMMVTNYAGYSPRAEYGPLRLQSLLTSVNGGPAMGTVGVCTVNGRLGMTLIGREAAAGLLDAVRGLLQAASRQVGADAARDRQE